MITNREEFSTIMKEKSKMQFSISNSEKGSKINSDNDSEDQSSLSEEN